MSASVEISKNTRRSRNKKSQKDTVDKKVLDQVNNQSIEKKEKLEKKEIKEKPTDEGESKTEKKKAPRKRRGRKPNPNPAPTDESTRIRIPSSENKPVVEKIRGKQERVQPKTKKRNAPSGQGLKNIPACNFVSVVESKINTQLSSFIPPPSPKFNAVKVSYIYLFIKTN